MSNRRKQATNRPPTTLFTRNPYRCHTLTTLQDWVFLLQESSRTNAQLTQQETQLRDALNRQIALLNEKIEQLESDIESGKYAQGVLAEFLAEYREMVKLGSRLDARLN